MFNFLIFIIGAALMLGMGVRSVLARRRLQTKGEKVTARVAGTAQGRNGQAYVLEFETAGGSHRLHYPKAAKGKGFAAGRPLPYIMTRKIRRRCMWKATAPCWGPKCCTLLWRWCWCC